MLSIKKLLMISSTALLSSLAMNVAAETSTHTVVAPNCLIKKTGASFKTLSANNGFQLIQTNSTGIDSLIKAKHHSKNCGGFRDVTRAWNIKSVKAKQPAAFLAEQTKFANKKSLAGDYKIQYKRETNDLIKTLEPENMWSTLTKLTQFKDRYANSDLGVKAAHHIKETIEQIAKDAGHADDFTAYYVETGDMYKQPSVVTKLGNGTGPGVVIGAHMDTLNSFWSEKPGADDDGSGTVTLLETARNILDSGMHFDRPIYFIWYSAEEMGLVGSDYVVSDFVKKKIPVKAAMQLDMTGYAHNNEPDLYLMKDYVDSNLTDFTAELIKTYVKKPVQFSRCGYACSDHASWTNEGFASVFPFESSMGTDNPNIHTSTDTMEHLSLEHMTDYAKLATAFAVELATPKSK